jgi:bacteriorhodopsin
MAGGAAVLAALGKRRTADEEGHTVLHAIVPLIAALGYLAQATRQGAVVLGGGRELLYARYVDWSITTPLLLLALAMTALHGAHRRAPLVAALLAADVLMILTGLFWGLSDATGPKWTWYVISCGAFLVVYAVLFGPLRREAAARDEIRHASYRRNVSVLAGLWLLYPVITLLGPDGTGVWSATVATATITVLDLLAKVGYGLLATAGSKRIADADLSREAAPAPRR